MTKAISPEEWKRIHEEYDYYPNLSAHEIQPKCAKYNDWERVYQNGCDSKYGTIMVSHSMKAYRGPTMAEFYGGGNAPWD